MTPAQNGPHVYRSIFNVCFWMSQSNCGEQPEQIFTRRYKCTRSVQQRILSASNASQSAMKISYSMPDEKITALAFAEQLQDPIAREILTREQVNSPEEAAHLSRFFWRMVARSTQGGASPPCEHSTGFWIEKLHTSIGSYLKEAGYTPEWNAEAYKAQNSGLSNWKFENS